MKDKAAGIPSDRLLTVRPRDEISVCGVCVTAVPAYNTNKPMHKKEFDWVGYIAEIERQKIYVAGDIDAMDEVLDLDVDVAFVPVGGTYTMEYKEAAAFINALKPGKAIPYHYGTFVGTPGDGEKFRKLVDPSIEVELIFFK